MEHSRETNSIDRILSFPFFAAAGSVLIFTYLFLYIIDFLPESKMDPTDTNADRVALVENERTMDADNEQAATASADIDPNPQRIMIDAIDMDVTVQNPEGRSIDALNAALREGAVRHPDSADFRDRGHMFILGHSSYLPTVHNLNYRAFNGIQDLTWGDLIRVRSGDTEYIYRVTEVSEVRASVSEIALNHSKARLTLATCDSFGSVDDRFVVDAVLIAEEPL